MITRCKLVMMIESGFGERGEGPEIEVVLQVPESVVTDARKKELNALLAEALDRAAREQEV